MASFRLVTFNIAHGRGLSLYQGFSSARLIQKNLNRITRVLTDADVDLVAMQEVDQNSFWNKNINLLDVIKQDTPYHYSYMGLNNVRPGRQNLNYGNALLSRYPITHSHNQPFSKVPIGGKGFMYAEIDLRGECLPLMNLHLDFRSRWRRLEQIEQVIAFLDERASLENGTHLPIICGDFNARAGRVGDAVQRLFDYLRQDREYELLPRSGRTFPAHFPARTIDFIYLPKRFRVLHCEVLAVYASDHRPVLVECEC